MFEVEYKGGNCVVISTKKAKLVSDPKLSVVGLKNATVNGAVIVATEERLAINSDTAVLNIESPGDYEVSDFSIHGVAARRHLDTSGTLATVYRIEIGDVRIALIGNIDAKLSEDQLEELGVVDMAILPIGGNGYTLDATSATQLLRAIDVKVVIPVHYKDTALNYEVPQDEIDVFKKEFGGEVTQTPKLKIKNATSLPTVQTIIEITRS